MDDEDEVLLTLANTLPTLIDLLGGKEHVYLLLQSLESLCAVEETVVRDAAVASFGTIAAHLLPQHVLFFNQIEEYALPMIKRLSSGDWFTSRTSACGLYTPVYALLSQNTRLQEELKKGYALLCNDDTPMVRRAAATNLSKLIQVIEPTGVQDLNNLLVALAGDEQDSVRLLTVDGLIAISAKVTPDQFKTFNLSNTVKSLVSDPSWRVRYMVADRIVKLGGTVPKPVKEEVLVPGFLSLLKDGESEVRTIVCTHAPAFCSLAMTSDVVVRDAVPLLKDLTSDSSQHVRAALAGSLNGLAPMLGTLY